MPDTEPSWLPDLKEALEATPHGDMLVAREIVQRLVDELDAVRREQRYAQSLARGNQLLTQSRDDEIARLRLIVDTRYQEGRATFLIDWLDPRRLLITGPTGREEDAIQAAINLILAMESVAEDLYNKSERGE
jgi:hypothetical protein